MLSVVIFCLVDMILIIDIGMAFWLKPRGQLAFTDCSRRQEGLL